MRVAALTSPMLNFWAAKAMGIKTTVSGDNGALASVIDPTTGNAVPFQPSLDWSQALPILTADWFDVETILIDWFGPNWPHMQEFQSNALTWFVRAFVALKFGEEVESLPTAERFAQPRSPCR